MEKKITDEELLELKALLMEKVDSFTNENGYDTEAIAELVMGFCKEHGADIDEKADEFKATIAQRLSSDVPMSSEELVSTIAVIATVLFFGLFAH